jgi:glycosyltransferase involved in cell wall biosynthesis
MDKAFKRRPKLLFLAHLFPPVAAIACVRTWNMAKHLARLGWDVTVVTPYPSVWRTMEDPENVVASIEREGIRRILTDHRWRRLSPYHLNCWNQGFGWFVGGICRNIARHLDVDAEIGWVKPAQRACSTLSAKDVDVILATGSPYSAFRLAKQLSDRLGRPYVLDYRDPWTERPYPTHPSRPSTIQEEARLLAGSSAVTIVSRSWGLAMERRFNIGPKLHVITNGCDPEDLANVMPCAFGHFAIVYAGIFYPPKRVISPVMAALRRLKETMDGKGGEWYFHYYGVHGTHVREEAARFGVMEHVVLHGRVSREEALSAVKGAGVATVITSIASEDSLADRGMVPAKVFEALGLNTPILLIAPPTSDAREIVSEREGLGIFYGSDVAGISRFLAQLISGEIRRNDATPAVRYGWPELAKRLDRLLRSVAAGGGTFDEAASEATWGHESGDGRVPCQRVERGDQLA